MTLNPLPDNKILDRSKLKKFADDNFKFDENSRKFSKRVENTVGKREIAHYEQFLLFPQCFQKACFLGVSKGVIVWEWVYSLPCPQSRLSTTLRKQALEKNVGIGENAGNQHFLLFLQCFLLYRREKSSLQQYLS